MNPIVDKLEEDDDFKSMLGILAITARRDLSGANEPIYSPAGSDFEFTQFVKIVQLAEFDPPASVQIVKDAWGELLASQFSTVGLSSEYLYPCHFRYFPDGVANIASIPLTVYVIDEEAVNIMVNVYSALLPATIAADDAILGAFFGQNPGRIQAARDIISSLDG